jgi:hypothetical protein
MSVIKNGVFIKDGIAAPVTVSEGFKRANFDDQRRNHAQQVLQRYVQGKPNGEWIRTNPEEAKVQFTEQEIRTYGNEY